MADLKKVMQKLNSQKSEKEAAAKLPVKKKKVAPAPEPEEEFEDDDEEDLEEDQDETDDEETEEDTEEEKVESDEAEQAAILANIEKLQNDGTFRYELLAVAHKIATELQVLNYQLLKAFGGEDGKKEK